MDIIEKYLPKTFYTSLSSEDRLRLLVNHWQRAVKLNQEMDEALEECLEYIQHLHQESPKRFKEWFSITGAMVKTRKALNQKEK